MVDNKLESYFSLKPLPLLPVGGTWASQGFSVWVHRSAEQLGVEQPQDLCKAIRKTRNVSYEEYPSYSCEYFPVSIILTAICCRNATVLNGSNFASRRTMASCVRSISPSATAAEMFFAAASTFSMPCIR